MILLFCCIIGLKNHAQTQLPDSAEYHKIAHITEEIAKQYAPDKRTAIFELQRPGDDPNRYQITTTIPRAWERFQQLLVDNHIADTKVTINLLPDTSVNGNASGIVNLSVANLRVAPRNQAELASQVLLGTPVDLLQKRDGYYRVRTPEGYIAWVSTSSITAKAQLDLKQWKVARKVIFIADYGHSYSAPDEQSLRVSDLVMGNILVEMGKSSGFIRVRYPDGRSAYVKSDLVCPFDEWLDTLTPTADNILDAAKTMMGVPYLWGGTSVKAVDCSGFTKTAYYMNGIIIPRDASQQVLAGQFVDILSADTLDTEKALRNLKPADLLFFASGDNRKPDARITHVALYLGDGEFIHSAGTVRINSMLSGAANYGDFQTRTLVAARRYIAQTDPALQPISQHHFYTLEKHHK